MAKLPARCTACGHSFQAEASADDVRNLSISNFRVRCPSCHEWAQVIEGRMNVRDGAIQMISGPQWSWDLVKELRLGLIQIAEQRPEDPVAAVEALDPKVGSWLRRATTGWSRDQILLLITGLLLPIILGIPGKWDALTVVYEQIEKALNDASPPDVAPPAPGQGPTGP